MNGGEIARGGFIYQDWAAAYYFITNEDFEQLNIEKHDDFSMFNRTEDPAVFRFFQAKSSDTGSLGWYLFRTKIFPNFYSVCEDFSEKDKLWFEIISNYKPSDQLKSFLDGLDDLRYDNRRFEPFRRQHERRVDQLKDSITTHTEFDEVDDDLFHKLLSYIKYDFQSIDNLVAQVELFIEKCEGGRKDYAKKTILKKIRNTDSGTISKRDLEEDIGYRLEKVQSSTGYRSSPQELRSEAQTMYREYKEEEIDVSKHARDKQMAEDYFQLVGGGSRKKNVEVEVSESDIKQGLEQAEQAKRDYQSAIQDITRGFENLFEVDEEIGDS